MKSPPGLNRVEQIIYGSTWAARYALGIGNPPREVLLPGQDGAWRDFEIGVGVEAAAAAAYAVERFRALGPEILDSYGESGRVLSLYRLARK